MGIHDLPPELLSEIASHLDFIGVLVLRQTTRTLREATEARVVWHSLAKEYSARHFNIPRPENGTIDTLETSDLREWIWPRLRVDQIWSKKIAPPTMRTLGMDEATTLLILIPGGRWLLVVRNTGQVYSYDLNSKEPTLRVLLEPTPLGYEGYRPEHLTVDINHAAPVLEFRFAFSATGYSCCVIISLRTAVDSFTYTGTYTSSWLHIRQARLVGAGPSATLTAHKIVSIPPPRNGLTCAVGLSGDRVARAIHGWIEVLKWKECESGKLMVASVHTQEGVQLRGRLYLIGEDRVLCVAQNVYIYKLPPFSHLVVNWRPEIGYQSNEDVTLPMWTYSKIPLTSISPPSFSFDGVDSYRLVVQDRREVVGIYIPLSSDERPYVRFRIRPGPLLPVGIGRYKGWIGYEDKPATRLRYEWDEDVDTPPFANAPGKGRLSFGQVLFDEEIGRCLLRKAYNLITIVDFI